MAWFLLSGTREGAPAARSHRAGWWRGQNLATVTGRWQKRKTERKRGREGAREGRDGSPAPLIAPSLGQASLGPVAAWGEAPAHCFQMQKGQWGPVQSALCACTQARRQSPRPQTPAHPHRRTPSTGHPDQAVVMDAPGQKPLPGPQPLEGAGGGWEVREWAPHADLSFPKCGW